MEAYLPLFPLNLVVFPNEALNLHIFEPRYKQLILDVLSTEKLFGIPSFVKQKIEYGTEVEIVKVEKEYEDGRLDIMTIGRRVFKVIELKNPLPDKLYAGGRVAYLENVDKADLSLQIELKEWLTELYHTLNLNDVDFPDDLNSFDIAHKIGLSLEDEYEFITINNEAQRQAFIINHLKKAMPMIKNIERTRTVIKMNGHFKSFDPLNF